MIASPYIAIAVLLAVLGSAVGGYAYGVSRERDRQDAARVHAVAAAVGAANAQAVEDLDRAVEAEARRQAARRGADVTRTRIEERIREVPVYLDRDCAAGDDVVGLLNDALAGRAAGGAHAASGGDGRVPADPAGATGRPAGDAGAGARVDGEGVSRLPGATR